MWPWCSPGGLAAGLALAVLAMAATWDGVWAVGVLLGAMALWPLDRTFLECGVARTVIVHGLKGLWPKEAF